MMDSSKKAPFGLISFLSLVGMGITIYLMYLHFGLLRGEILGEAFCGGEGGLLNCHAVTASRWGSFYGVPTALIGLLGYVWILALSFLGMQSDETAEKASGLILITAALFVLTDAYLLYVMLGIIKHLCLFCLGTYAVNVLIVLLALRGVSMSKALADMGANLVSLLSVHRWPSLGLFWTVLFVGVLGVAGVHISTQFVRNGTLKSMKPQIEEYVKNQQRVEVSYDNRPTKGEGAQVRMVEYSDFMCPICKRAAKMNSIILANHRKDASLTFKHYPLDQSCNDAMSRAVHPGSCRIAEAAACAGLQNKFWDFHDRVFAGEGTYDVSQIPADAEAVGLNMESFKQCLANGEGLQIVKEDVDEANGLNVRSTPTFVVNGIVVRGMLQPETFNDFAEAVQ